MKTTQEFEQFYSQSLLTDLTALDQRRKRIVNRFLIMFFAVFVPIVAVSVIIPFYWGIAIAFVAALLLYVLWVHDNHFYKDFKTQVINRIVYFISPDLKYEPQGYINQGDFAASRLFMTSIDRYKGDDLVEGKIEKTAIRFSEVKAEYKTTTTDGKGNRRTTWHTIFKGLFFIADFNKEFIGSTVVLPNSFGSGFKFLKKLASVTRREKLVELEDVNFKKQFNVYGDDQIEARYILSTSLMERIMAYKAKTKNNIYMSFVNSQMYLGISYNKDLFEPSYLKSLTKIDVCQSYFEDMVLVISIVDDLNLNLRIWTKE